MNTTTKRPVDRLVNSNRGTEMSLKGEEKWTKPAFRAIGRRGVLALFFTEKAILNNPMLHNKAKYTQKGGEKHEGD